MKQRLFLIFHGRFPGEKAASVFTAKNAEAFASRGLEVIILAPRRIARSKVSPSEYFGVKDNFDVVYLPILDMFALPLLKHFAFLVTYTTFSISVLFYLLFRARVTDIIYSNEALPLLCVPPRLKNIFYEVHDFPKDSFLNRRLMLRAKGIIATNKWKANEIGKLFVVQEKVLYEPNAVDVSLFEKSNELVVRQSFSLPVGSVLVGYVGALHTMGKEKGIEFLLEVIKKLPSNFYCLIVGGNPDDVERFGDYAEGLGIKEHIIFTGWVKHSDVASYMKACDVLVAPYPKNKHYNLYMSPMKLFEYMAAGKPIVATRLHSIEEIVNDEDVFFVEPENVLSFMEGIISAVSSSSADEKARRVHAIVENHTWKKRANRILKFISH